MKIFIKNTMNIMFLISLEFISGKSVSDIETADFQSV